MSDTPLTHVNKQGEAHMVDIGQKAETRRRAIAGASISGSVEAISALWTNELKKGDALAAARIAGIMAAKKTSDLIPLCHPLAITKVEIAINRDSDTELSVSALVETKGQTGVEMEALTAASVAALTLYDMAKAIDKGLVISKLMLLEKSGGKSGDYSRD